MSVIVKRAYAKINLTFEILGKRPDGYHEIRSVMHKIPLCDEISARVSQGEGITLCCDTHPCDEKENLAYGAAERYLEQYRRRTGDSRKVDLTLKKNIPPMAGLAGGSADGAAVLDALYTLMGGLSYPEVEQIARGLGSDMAFCLEKYTCALASGRGIDLAPLPALDSGFVLVAIPEQRVSTELAYKRYDRRGTGFSDGENSAAMARVLRRGGGIHEISPYAVNEFEPVCFTALPAVRRLRGEMIGAGAVFSQMTGSGSAVFGVFDNEQKGSRCARRLGEMGIEEFSLWDLNKLLNK